MSELQLHQLLVAGMALVALGTFGFSLLTTAPYGRYDRPWWSGPQLPSWLAWMLMELPQPVGFGLCFALGDRGSQPVALVFLGMWMAHYAYRTLIYPFVPRASTMSLFVVALGFVLNCGFSYLNGRWLFTLGPERELSWLGEPRFLVGAALFVGGFVLSCSSDLILRSLRKASTERYVVPHGGGFRWVSSPNYLGELIEFGGWALATWSAAGLVLFAVSAANLVPRALRNHRWYRQRFADYPARRKALVPYLL
jgi:protein-S-isoprenylcysteine O-methyltransferase Ste14